MDLRVLRLFDLVFSGSGETMRLNMLLAALVVSALQPSVATGQT
jgi:hypothetical protein